MDLWIDVDTAVTVPVNLLPLLDDTDFKSREVAIAYDAAGMDLVWNFVTCAGVVTQTAVTPTTGGVYDWSHVGDGIYKIEIPASGGGSINNDTEGFGWFTGLVTGVLPWRGPVIGFRAAGLNDLLIESAYSATRGLSGTALPAAAAEAAGGLYTRGSGAGQINQQANGQVDANVERLVNVAQSATDLKDFADDGYDPSTNKVTGVVLTDTVTTYTGNTPQTGDSFARLGAPAGASVSADIAAIEAQTDDIGVNGVGLSAIPDLAGVTTLLSRLGTPSNLGGGATVAANLADIEAQTDDIGAAGAGLTSIPDSAGTGTLLTRVGTPSNLGGGATVAANLADIEGQTDDIGAAGAGLTSIPDSAGVTTLLSRITSTLFANITSLGHWLGALAGKQAANATAQTEIRASGAGSGTFDPTTDSVEAIRDRGDAAWVTGTAPLDAAGVRSAVGLASANLDTQLSGIQSDTDNLQTRVPAALVSGRIDASVGAMAADVVTASALAADGVAEIKNAILPPINTALANLEFLMVDATDHVTPETGLTVTGSRSIDGGAFAAVTGTIAEVGNGIYQFDASAADMNGTFITFRFTSAGADDRFILVRTGG